MEDHLQNHYNRSFPGCMKGLVHFLNLQHHLHLRKMKMLTYKKHGEGKRVARNKVPRTYPDIPSTSQEFLSNDDESFVVEDKVNDTRRKSIKPSIRISFPKWRLREHNNKKIKDPPTSRLLRTPSIHHMSENHSESLNFDVEASIIEQNAEENKDSSINEEVYVLHNIDDDHSFEEQCDKNMTCGKIDDGELESLLHKAASFSQKYTNAKEMNGDVMLYPSKEFLDMMNLFNGNLELIRKILEDPSFIFAHYLQSQLDSNAQLMRNYSFPTQGKLERNNGGLLRINHKRFESESLVKQSSNFPSENPHSNPDIVKDDTPRTKITADGLVAPLQKLTENPSSSSHFKTIKLRIKDIIKASKNEHHNHISMDGILHKVPYGGNVLQDTKKTKPGQWDVPAVQKLFKEGLKNKGGKRIDKSINRSQSLNESLDQYSYLYESITKGEFKRLPEREKFVKAATKTLGRMFSLSDIKYYSTSKDVRIEDCLRPASPKNLTTFPIKENLEKEESKEFIIDGSSKWALIDYEKITSLSNEEEQCELSKTSAIKSLIKEDINVIPLQEQGLMDEVYTFESKISDPISTSWSFALEDVSLDFLDKAISKGSEHKHQTEGGLECNEAFLQRPKPSPDTDCFDFPLQNNRKHEADFNYVREILRRSGFIGNDFLGAWHNPYQPIDPLVFSEVECLDFEPDIIEVEHNMLEHQLLFDMINEALVEIYEDSFGYYFPWLSHFSTYIRPVPMGNHILERVWVNVYWHLKGQTRLDQTLDDIVARDFTKNDGWMDIQYDIEDVELEVECLILDDVLDEILIQLFILTGFQPNPLNLF